MKQINLAGALARFTEAGKGTDPLRQNLGLHVGDDPALVHYRREALSHEVGAPLLWMDQTHSTEVVLIDSHTSLPTYSSVEYGPISADALVVDARGWEGAPGACVMVADCLPILFGAEDGAVIAAAHAGRQGLLGGILTRVVDIYKGLGIDPADIEVAIGPAACAACYEVPEDMRSDAVKTHPATYGITRQGTPSIDLVRGAEQELRRCGIMKISIDARCTIEDKTLHSHRRDPAHGRQVGVVVPFPVLRHAELP